jgi:hypothetical protein
MKTELLLRDPIFQLNLLLWMAKEQPPQRYVVKPLFFENRFAILTIEHQFALPVEVVKAVAQSQQEVSTAPEPEMLLGRAEDKKALYFEAKANSFSPESSRCKQARGHLLAAGPAFAEVMAPYQSCLLCYVVPEDKRSLMADCLSSLSAELAKCGLKPGQHSSHGLALVAQEVHYVWDIVFQTHTGVSGNSAVVLSGLTDDTDPTPLFLIYSDEDYPDAENRDLLRRCVVNQVHTRIVCDLRGLRDEETYERSAASIVEEMSEGLSRYLGTKRQKAMRRLVAENVFRRIAEHSREKYPGVKLVADVLQITFADEEAKTKFLEWLEDFNRTAFQASKPPPGLFDQLDGTGGGGEE